MLMEGCCSMDIIVGIFVISVCIFQLQCKCNSA
jgi:hypothetical protein